MIAVKLIEFRTIVRAVLRPIPPVPIAAFGDQQFFVSQLARVLRNIRRFVISAPRGQQQFPSLVVFFRADPDVEIRVDPRARENAMQRLGFEFRQRL